MTKNIDDLLRVLTFEVLSAERRNLRSKALTDQKMSEEIQKIIIDNYQRNSILVFFSDQKNDLFQDDLEDNEIYFNIACGYDKMVSPSLYEMEYLNCDESYFSINALKKVNDLEPYFEKLFLRILELQNVIKEIFNDKNVQRITYYHTDDGNENSINDYELVDWDLEEFAYKFFMEIKKLKGFTPTIKIVFSKSNNDKYN